MERNTTKAKNKTKKTLQKKREKVQRILSLKIYVTDLNVEHVATYKI